MQTSIARQPARQRGMGWFGLLLVFAAIGFIAICVIKVGPLYLNHMTVARVVSNVADDPEMANADVRQIRSALERRWAIDYIDQLDFKDVKVKRSSRGRMLSYDYEARVNLFYNVYVVIHFKNDHMMRGADGA